MSEIIPIFVGGFGVQAGLNFVKALKSEHLDSDGNFQGR